MNPILAAIAPVIAALDVASHVSIEVKQKHPTDAVIEQCSSGRWVMFADSKYKPEGVYEIGERTPIRRIDSYKLTRVRKDGKGLTKDTTSIAVCDLVTALTSGLATFATRPTPPAGLTLTVEVGRRHAAA